MAGTSYEYESDPAEDESDMELNDGGEEADATGYDSPPPSDRDRTQTVPTGHAHNVATPGAVGNGRSRP